MQKKQKKAEEKSAEHVTQKKESHGYSATDKP